MNCALTPQQEAICADADYVWLCMSVLNSVYCGWCPTTPCLKKNCASVIFWITSWNIGRL